MTERLDNDTLVALMMAQLCKNLIEPGEAKADLYCPLCGTTLSYSRVRSNGHVAVSCKTAKCINLVE